MTNGMVGNSLNCNSATFKTQQQHKWIYKKKIIRHEGNN